MAKNPPCLRRAGTPVDDLGIYLIPNAHTAYDQFLSVGIEAIVDENGTAYWIQLLGAHLTK